ncbi:DUF2637 domain-containing protein [Catenulispora acidiphila]|nr:DUF2637 domain-containing protein [Catenulispora acidiphila]
MSVSLSLPMREERQDIPGEALTRRAVTTITGVIAGLTFVFSFGNVAALAAYLHVPLYIGWLVGPAVDLSVVGLLLGIRYLSLHGYTDKQLEKPRRLLILCGLLTMALNTAESICAGRYGTAAFDAVAPLLLLGWSENGPWLLRQIYTVRSLHAATGPGPAAAEQASATAVVPVLDNADSGPAEPPAGQDEPAQQAGIGEDPLLARARELDKAHRRTSGRGISRDRLRDELRIQRNRASELCQRLRAEAAAAAVDAEPAADAPEREVALVAV